MNYYFLIICVISTALLIRSVKTNAICKYEVSHIRIEQQSSPIYGCKLKVNETGMLSKVQGQHKNSKDDSEIEAINKISGSILNEFPSLFCNKFENLQVIVFSGAEVKRINENSFQNCKNLRILDLFNNQITKIPDDLLAGNSKLIKLSLASNKIENLPPNLFVNQKNLKNLDLSQNKLNVLNPVWFKALESLEIINLNDNEIAELPASVFASLENLQALNIASNNLKRIDSDSFGTFSKLKIINLKDNKIEEISSNFFEEVAVEKLNLENNVCLKKTIIVNEMRDELEKCLKKFKPTQIHATPVDDTEVMDKCKIKIQKHTNKLKLKYKECFGKDYVTATPLHPNNIKCGKSKLGQNPWFAYITDSDGRFFCIGTLISSKHVISMAHCIRDKSSFRSISSSDITIVLGKPQSVSCLVQKIEIHPDWNPNTESFDADLSILTLESEVLFNDYIQPICLIDKFSELELISNLIHLGFETTEEAKNMDLPKRMETPIHNNEKCLLADPSLAKFSSKRTFCGGYKNITESCLGNSGAPLIVSKNNINYLRGMASARLINADFDCESFTVYTNLVMYIDWISSILTSGQQEVYLVPNNNSFSIVDISVNSFIENMIKDIKENLGIKILNTDMKCSYELLLLKNDVNKNFEKCVENQKTILNYGITAQNKCGKPKILRGTIIGGSRLIQGSFPWIAALLQKVQNVYKFICGGTIISSKKVVTAAHCVLSSKTEERLRTEHAKVLLGMHNLSDPSEIGRIEARIKTIVPHHHWNPKSPSFDADIAVLELENEIQFTVYIQPICLIPTDAVQEEINKGYVVGYGKSEDRSKIHEETPKIIETPIMDFNNCSDTFSDLESLLSNRMFCGGYANGTGTCVGDSGSGLYVEHEGTYYLRGVVSSSLYNHLNECNVNKPSAFTDAVDFYIFMTTGKAGSRKID